MTGPRFAQNSTKCTASTHCTQCTHCTIVVTCRVSWLVTREARMGHTVMGIHGSLLRGLMAPEFLSQGCSKILHSILFWIFLIFSFFPGNPGWDPWNLTQESTHWIFWFETGFIISRDLFNIYRYWFCLFRVFEGIFSHHQLGTKNLPEIRLKIRISWQFFSPIHNLTSLRFSLNPVMFKFGIFPLNFELSSSTLSFQDHTLWFFVWHVIISWE